MFTIEQTEAGIRIRLEVQTLDASNAPEFKERLRAIRLDVAAGAVVDCSGLEFVDSSGVGALLNVNNSLAEAARPVQLENVSNQVLAVLELLRIHRILDVKAAA